MQTLLPTKTNAHSFYQHFFVHAPIKLETSGMQAASRVDIPTRKDRDYVNTSNNTHVLPVDAHVTTLQKMPITEMLAGVNHLYKTLFFMYMDTAIHYCDKDKMSLVFDFCMRYGIDDESPLGPESLYRSYLDFCKKRLEAPDNEGADVGSVIRNRQAE